MNPATPRAGAKGSADPVARREASRARSLLLVAGARPNFMKVAPLLRAFSKSPSLAATLVHTGQHYDEALSDRFFRDLGIPAPVANLGVGSGSHAEQTAEVMRRIEPVLAKSRPDLLIVVGDVNSTVAAALVGAKLEIPIAHVEAGLRSFDRSMPEEVNRVVTDALASWHFVTEEAGRVNLAREGHRPDRVHLVGNVMVDTLLGCLESARERGRAARTALSLRPGAYAVSTIHRPSNVDRAETLRDVLSVLAEIGRELPVVLPVHPRTRARIEAFGLSGLAASGGGLRLVDPLGYLEFLGLFAEARLVLTDSGGIQEEASVLRVPCVTLRENTERPSTIECGGNVLAGSDPRAILEHARRAVRGEWGTIVAPALWDGRAAERIAEVLERAETF